MKRINKLLAVLLFCFVSFTFSNVVLAQNTKNSNFEGNVYDFKEIGSIETDRESNRYDLKVQLVTTKVPVAGKSEKQLVLSMKSLDSFYKHVRYNSDLPYDFLEFVDIIDLPDSMKYVLNKIKYGDSIPDEFLAYIDINEMPKELRYSWRKEGYDMNLPDEFIVAINTNELPVLLKALETTIKDISAGDKPINYIEKPIFTSQNGTKILTYYSVERSKWICPIYLTDDGMSTAYIDADKLPTLIELIKISGLL